MIYDPPFDLDIMIIGPVYLGFIFLSKEDSISVFLMSTKSPGLKFKSLMVCRFSFSYFTNHSRLFSSILDRISITCCLCLARAIALKPINSAVAKTLPGNFTSQVSSTISRGKMGCAPVVIKKGEQPYDFLKDILSGHKTWGKNQKHFEGLAAVALYNI